MWQRIRDYLIGSDDARYFDFREYLFLEMRDVSLTDRFVYIRIVPLLYPFRRLQDWARQWDYKFWMRYEDRNKVRRARALEYHEEKRMERWLRDLRETQAEVIEMSPRAPWVGYE